MNMKNLIIAIVVFFNIGLYSQEKQKINFYTGFHLSILGGINYTNSFGPSVNFEGNIFIIRNLNLKFSLGYMVAYKDNFQKVKAYRHIVTPGFSDNYQTEDYNIYDTKYRIVPISLGFEYVFNYKKISPYSFITASYNAYDAKYDTSPIVVGAGGYYNSYNNIPTEYKNEIPLVPGAGSFGLSFGIGSRIYLSKFFDFDIRYLYQLNSNIVNIHEILVGFMF